MGPLDPGTAVGGFRIVRLLRGGAGAGAVYEATGGGLHRPVALKIFAQRLSESPEFRERFRREAPRIAAVEHPGITRTYEAGSSKCGLYLAMRLVDGPTLAELVGRGALAPDAALELLGPVAEALDLAHDSGVLHRDLKPEKILVSESERAFLTGFSIPRSPTRGERGGPGRARSSSPYLAPEQARGEPPRRRSEVYALGAVLYEALAGIPPFRAEPDEAAIKGTVNGSPPSLEARNPELPEQLDEVFVRALSKDPNERPGTAGELIADLRRALRGGTSAGVRLRPTHVAAAGLDPASSHDRSVPDSGRAPAARPERRGAGTLAARRRLALRAVPAILGLTAAAAVAGWYLPGLLGLVEDRRDLSAAPRVSAPAPTSDAYGGALSRTLERLNERRAVLERRLAQARTAPGQAGAARALAQAHSGAATALSTEPRTPRERRTNTAIVGALREVAAAYRAMAATARRGDARAFGVEVARARRSEARVRSAVRGLTALGYSVE